MPKENKRRVRPALYVVDGHQYSADNLPGDLTPDDKEVTPAAEWLKKNRKAAAKS